ncbi:uncharacterized protein L203_103627 [Cryptococcus depauperatus CBS 7841]|uniref:Uncharacterized protein n=1 Tax=Cryptococcus depauperatus CBS 7841 TaxID=1295531 RepID=A0A1E3IHU3_9TREE|nr:3-oxo-5-alpha-steroid 4-dehydrogenase 1 [Cryptococcus depauperatus CBS 7841]
MIPPSHFFPALLTFHLFPLHAPITLFGLDAPFGRFSDHNSRLNINGNLAWSLMELVSPITFITTLFKNNHPPLNLSSHILAGLYLFHYAHRAIISPLVLSPKRSPLHLAVPLAAIIFNFLNGYLLALGLAFYPVKEPGWTFYLCIVGWAIGFFGNVYHDEILNDLRRPRDRRLILADLPEDKDTDAGRYKIPRGCLFEFVSFPNYLCEWLEWAAWSLAANPCPFIALPPFSSLLLTTGPTHTFLSILSQIYWPKNLLAPSWTFVLAEVASMLPRAIRGHEWYKKKFGDKYPKERKAVIPGIL